MNRDRKIEVIAFIVLCGFVASVFFHYVMGNYERLRYPYNTFLFTPADRFADFTVSMRAAKNLDPYITASHPPSLQYPFVHLLFYLFTLLPSGVALPIYLTVIVVAFVRIVARSLAPSSRRGYLSEVFILSLLTYPFLFALDRGNVETLVFILLLGFARLLTRGRSLASACLLAIAIAVKVSPVVLVVLYARERRFREIGVALGGALALNMMSLACFSGGMMANLSFVLHGSNFDTFSWAFGNTNVVQRGVSLFTMVKILAVLKGAVRSLDMNRVLAVYTGLALLVFGALAAYTLKVESQLWKAVALMVNAMLLLPYLSGDYKLLHLFVPMLLFMDEKTESPMDWFYSVVFALLLIPKDYYILPGLESEGGNRDISVAVPLNAALLIVMTAGIIVSGLASSERACRSPGG
jgi:hypothetical protein